MKWVDSRQNPLVLNIPNKVSILNNANIRGANIRGANIRNASLIEVENITHSQIKLACYWEQAVYKGKYDEKIHNWIVDDAANQEYIEELKQDKASEPKEKVDCSMWEIIKLF